MKLDLQKGVRFTLFCPKEFWPKAYSIPTSRKAPRQQHITFKATVEVMRALNRWVEDGTITPTTSAQVKLNQLLRQYLNQRKAIRTSERQFKNNSGPALALPMKHKPFNHQNRAIGFSIGLDGSALFMDTGTGKTYCSMAIAGLRYLEKKVKRLLVICPKSALPVWERQYKEHADYDYSFGVAEAELPQMETRGLQVIATNYDRLKKLKKQIERWKPDMLVGDESQKIKRRTAIRSKVMHYLGDRIHYKLILSATPLGQQPTDIWSQFRCVSPDIFGRDYRRFEDHYVEKGGYMGYEVLGYKDLGGLAEKMHSIAFRCKLRECMDMPRESHVKLYCDATSETRRIYKELDIDFLTDFGDDQVSVDVVVAKMMKLRQITGGLVKTDAGVLRPVSEAKTSLFREHMEDRPKDAKTLVFCSFLHEVELALQVCKDLNIKAKRMTGSTSAEERGVLENEFQTTDLFQVLVCQVDVGGESLDLFAADQAIFYSPTFSFIKYHQAKGRIFRIGQDKPVAYVHLLMKDTVDEQIMSFIERHGDLTTKIMDQMRTYQLRRD